MIKIVSVTPEDAGELLDIYKYYVENTAITFEYTSPTPESFRERIIDITKKFPYIKAIGENGEILGYAYADTFHAREAYDWAVELSVYVKKDSRRQGIGKLLYNRMFSVLYSMGITNLYACIAKTDEQTPFLTNDSIDFHSKMGFHTVGEFHNCGYKFDRWFGMVYMEKIIAEHKIPQPYVKFNQCKQIADFKISPRLEAVYDLLGEGDVADIGSDHALLPIYICQNSDRRVLASDLNENPCKKAIENVSSFGLSDRITVKQADGLCQIENFAPSNIVIAGMGGELIADVLSKSGYPKASKCRLILQPMTMQDKLRRFLAENGYAVLDEVRVLDGGKYYQLIVCEYTGEKYSLTGVQEKLGQVYLDKITHSRTQIDTEWLLLQREAAEKRIEGRKKSSSPVAFADDVELVEVINKILGKEI